MGAHMAQKKEPTPNKPVLSRVPLPVSDSALVIDLPDGQKLVIGKMNQGTVIEVATWRGVGRPDSRTNRMMFGMSSAEIDDDAGEAQISGSSKATPDGLVAKIWAYPVAIFMWLFNIKTKPKSRNGRQSAKTLIIEPKVEGPTNFPSTQSSGSTPEANSSVMPLAKKISIIISTSVASLKIIGQAALNNGKKIMSFKNRKASTLSKPTPVQDQEIDDWLASITTKVRNTPSAAKVSQTAKTTEKISLDSVSQRSKNNSRKR